MNPRAGVLVLALLVVLVTLATGFEAARVLRHPMAIGDEDQSLYVVPGTGISRLGDELVRRGWLESSWPLTVYARLTQHRGSIKAGEYLLSPGMTVIDLVRHLRAGEVREYTITFPEGFTTRQILARLNAAPGLLHRASAMDDADLVRELDLDAESLEGLFFPDTYRYRSGTEDLRILEAAHRKLEAELNEAWQSRSAGLPLESPRDVLILASIIEKETGSEADRDRVAAVFVNRLTRGMRLQSDPTVIYGLGDAFDGDLRTADLQQPTAYNTYLLGGLPPTPICNPGRRSITAAVHPADEDSLYFVARGDGTSVFSRTLEEHNRAVRRYQLRSPNR